MKVPRIVTRQIRGS